MTDIWMWVGFNAFIVAMLAVDLTLHGKQNNRIGMKEAFAWSAVWIGLALAFCVLIYSTLGTQPALDFLTAYLIEESLSIDNLFVFLMIFTAFKTPWELLHRTLFWGILGAIIMRAIFIFAGIALVSHFTWLFYLFGAFLMFIGIKMTLKKEEEVHPENNIVLRAFKKFMPVTDDYRGTNFFIREQGVLYATPLFVVLLVVETTDLIFAIDSIPAVLAITLDPFIVYTSNIFAVLGLRSIFFALASLMHLFVYLHYALGAILTLVGVKMILSPWLHVPVLWTLSFIVLSIGAAIVASLLKAPKSEA